jgi:hypothetical protein
VAPVCASCGQAPRVLASVRKRSNLRNSQTQKACVFRIWNTRAQNVTKDFCSGYMKRVCNICASFASLDQIRIKISLHWRNVAIATECHIRSCWYLAVMNPQIGFLDNHFKYSGKYMYHLLQNKNSAFCPHV